jgi:dTDP-4-amino-4,6-dideoxygalactose transaminase
MQEQFLLPKDPRLSLGMFFPFYRRSSLPAKLNGRPIHYLFWARNAIYHGLRVLNLEPGDNVLVPSYHCTSVVEPVLQYGCKVKFYNVGLDVKSDLREIESKIDPKTRVVLVIHYFGFPQPIASIKRFCRERGLYLIEDCAHVLTGQTAEAVPLGTTGDISIFSWRKFLPVYDGGQLVINNPDLQLESRWEAGGPLFGLKIAKNLLDKLLEDSSHVLVNRLATLSQAPSALFHRLAGANGYRQNISTVNSYDLDFDLASANLKMSRLSQYILRNTDVADVTEKRRSNYRFVAEGIKRLPGAKPLYPSLPEQVVPWVFPLLAHGVLNLHLKLRERGIPATNWSGVVHGSLPLHRFPDARFLYDNLVFLPIHQSLRKRELEMMLKILDQVLNERVAADAKSFDGGVSLSTLSGR